MNITEYIRNNPKLSSLDFTVVYVAIEEFIKEAKKYVQELQ